MLTLSWSNGQTGINVKNLRTNNPSHTRGSNPCVRQMKLSKVRHNSRGCPGVPVHGGIPIVFTSIHGVVTQFVNVSFLCVPVHEDTTQQPNEN